MELDFTGIRFCGRYKELQELNYALDQVVAGFNRGSDEHDSSACRHPSSDESVSDSSSSSSSVKPGQRFVTIEGATGTGKTMLVEHFLGLVAEKQQRARLPPDFHDASTYSTGGNSSGSSYAPILLGRGKFEESSTMPFSSFADCISSLLDDILKVDPDWSDNLTADTRREIRRLSSIVPNIRNVLGSSRDEAASTTVTGSSSDSSSQSSRQWAFERTRISFRSLIEAITANYTVMLVLDDLQWASEDCIKLLESVITDKKVTNLFLLATHRDFVHSYPAYDLKNAVDQSLLTRITLGDLSPMDICDVVESLLGGRDAEEEDIQGLALMVHSKTGGTIFVVVEFLRMLYEREFITYSFQRLRWEFNLDRIGRETSVYGSVLRLLCDKMASLPKPLQVPLITAAFLGFSSFDAALLYHVLKGAPIHPSANDDGFRTIDEYEGNEDPEYIEIQDSDELQAILRLAVKEGLLERLEPSTRHREGRGEWYRFSHDRVCEGALSLVSHNLRDQENMHLQMGLELRRIRDENVLGADEDELERLLLHAVRHLNRGINNSNARAERVELSRMNLEAAIVVIERSAFPAALEFLQTGLGFLDDETMWEDDYNLTLQLTDNLTQVRFCTGHHEHNWRTLDSVLEHGRSTKDKLNAYRTLILSLATEGRFDEAISTNLTVLDKLGVSFPRNFFKIHMAQALNRARGRLKGSAEDVFIYRDDVDEITRYQCEFLGTLSETCSLSGHDDYRVMGMFRATDYIINSGIEELAPMAMLGCAYQCALLGEVDKSYKFGKLAAKIAMEGKNPRNDGKAIALAYESPIAMKEPYHKCLDSLLTAFKFILDNGEIQHLYLPIYAYSNMYFHCGLRLGPLKKDVLRFAEMLESFGQTSHLRLYRPFIEFLLNLMGPHVVCDDDWSVSSARCSLDIPSDASQQVMQHYYRYEMMLAFFVDDLSRASEMSSKLNAAKVEGPSSWLPPRFFYQGLIEYALCRKTGKNKHRRQGRIFLKKLEKFSKLGNVNCQNMLLLLRAEHLSLERGAADVVQRAYDAAIKSSGKLGFLHGQGLANELAGIHFLERGDRSWASTYLGRSVALFEQWGAKAKTRQMENKYGQLLGKKEEVAAPYGSFLRGVSRAQDIVDSSSSLRTKSQRHLVVPRPDSLGSYSDGSLSAQSCGLPLPTLGFQSSFGERPLRRIESGVAGLHGPEG